MKATHTPGPLTVTHQALTDQSWDLISEHPSGGICVATCGCSADEHGQVAANAQRLVACWNACLNINPAAVPALVEALQAISATSVPQSTATKEVWIAAGQRWIAAIEKARAALAKAKEVA